MAGRSHLGHREGRGGGELVAVLDRAHAKPHAPLDRGRRVGVSQHVGVLARCLVDDRRNLLVRELQVVQPVCGARHASTRHDLDRVRALPELVPARLPALVDAVDDAPDAGSVHAAAVIPRRTEVAVAARLRERMAHEEQPRAHSKDALVRRSRKAAVSAARVAQAREPALEALPELDAGSDLHVRRGNLTQGCQISRTGGQVHVRVDEARDQERRRRGDVWLLVENFHRRDGARRMIYCDLCAYERCAGFIQDERAWR